MTNTHIASRATPVSYRRDAPPFVRAVARLLELNAYSPDGIERLARFHGCVGLVCEPGPQAATLRATETGIVVEHGLAEDATLRLPVTLHLNGIVVPDAPQWSAPQGVELRALLRPDLPDWPRLAEAFWDEVHGLDAMPSLRLVERDGQRRVDLGPDRSAAYEIHGSPAALSALLSGTAFFAEAVYAGELQIKGTLNEFSVVAGASMKVMWNV